VEEPFMAKVIRSVLPMFLVAALSTLNVVNKVTAGSNLENSIAISLPLVFLLPELKPHTIFDGHNNKRDNAKRVGFFERFTGMTHLLTDNTMLFSMFFGLVIASCTWGEGTIAQHVQESLCNCATVPVWVVVPGLFPEWITIGGITLASGVAFFVWLWNRVVLSSHNYPRTAGWTVLYFGFTLFAPPCLTPKLLELVLSLFSCDDATLGVVGNFFIWLSMCVPYYNYVQYSAVKTRIIESSKSLIHPGRSAFCPPPIDKDGTLSSEEASTFYGGGFNWDAYDKKKGDLVKNDLNATVAAAEDDTNKPKTKKGKFAKKLHSELKSVWRCKEDKKFLNVTLGPDHEI
jgi:hypothetical protein